MFSWLVIILAIIVLVVFIIAIIGIVLNKYISVSEVKEANDGKELLKKVRRIEIKTRRLSDHIFSGEYHSSFKGRGMSFSEVRKYEYGDDVRAIDWNVTAKLNEPYIKVFEEERELTFILMIDVSASEFFGSIRQSKKDLITELSAVLAFSAIQNNDKVGAIFFSNQIEKFIPPKKGKKHILRIIRELLEFKPQQKETDISEALKYLSNVSKKKAIVFVLSDFIAENYHDVLKIASRKHDLTGIRIYDKREEELPNLGLIKMQDSETGKMIWVNSMSKKVRAKYRIKQLEKANYFQNAFRKTGAGSLSIRTDEDYVKSLLGYFKRR